LLWGVFSLFRGVVLENLVPTGFFIVFLKKFWGGSVVLFFLFFFLGPTGPNPRNRWNLLSLLSGCSFFLFSVLFLCCSWFKAPNFSHFFSKPPFFWGEGEVVPPFWHRWGLGLVGFGGPPPLGAFSVFPSFWGVSNYLGTLFSQGYFWGDP